MATTTNSKVTTSEDILAFLREQQETLDSVSNQLKVEADMEPVGSYAKVISNLASQSSRAKADAIAMLISAIEWDSLSGYANKDTYDRYQAVKDIRI